MEVGSPGWIFNKRLVHGSLYHCSGCNVHTRNRFDLFAAARLVGHHEQPPYSYGWQAKPFVDVCWCWSPLWAASFTPVTGFLDNLLVVVLVMVGHDRNHADECCRSHCTEVENYAAGLLYRHWYFSSLDMDVTFMELFRFVTLLVVVVRLTNHEP